MPTVTGRSMQVPAAGGDFELVQREFPEPGPGQVRIRVQACGVCHSDSITKFGLFPGIPYPRVPGHEVAGVIDAVAADVPVFKVGQRVGLGWHGGHCNYCTPCRRGDFILCENQQISGISYDGGYADYVLAPANALALIPDDLADVDAAPLMCAGVTTYNSLRHSGAAGRSGGHPGHRWAGASRRAVRSQAGYHTVAIARGQDKAPLAKELGAHLYIDSTTQSSARNCKSWAALRSFSPPSPAPSRSSRRGLGPEGKLMIVGVPEKPLDFAHPAGLGQPHHRWLGVRHRHGLGRHTQLQRPHRGQAEDRNLHARARLRRPSIA